MNRRDFLTTSLGGVAGLALDGALPAALPSAVPGNSLLQADANEFVFSRFKYITLTSVQDAWDTHPIGDDLLLQYLARVSNVKVSTLTWEQRVVAVDDFASLYKRPFLFMTGEGNFHLSTAEAEALGEHFRRGGFIFADDCVAGGRSQNGDFFYQAFKRELPNALPGYQWEEVPPTHEIYHCFFDIPGGRSPFCQGQRRPDLGITMNGRLVAFLTSGDLHCGWVGQFFPPRTRQLQEECFNMAVNVIIYSLTH